MKNFLAQNLKRSLTYFLILSLTTSFFPSQSYAGYGIAIDIEELNLPGPTIRVLFLNIDEQKVEEVNYYSVLDSKTSYKYMIPIGVQHKENPLLGFEYNNKTLQNIIVKDTFTTDNYTVISKFPLRTLSSIVYPSTANGDRYYKIIDAPRTLKDLTTKETPKKHKPTFHYVEPKTNAVRRGELLEKALGGFDGKATQYTKHKEKMGEYTTLLTLLEYGYTTIYDTKLGQTGMDFMVFSGDDPSKDTFLLVESKWTSNKDASLTHLRSELNSQRIMTRLQLLSKETNYEPIMQLIRAFFETKNAKIYKFLYKVFDNSKQMRGVAKPALELIEEQERIEIGTRAGIIKLPLILNILKAPDASGALPVSSKTTPYPAAQINNQDDLLPFISYLEKVRADLTPLSLFIKETYPTYYEEFSNGPQAFMPVNQGLRTSNFTDFEEETKEEALQGYSTPSEEDSFCGPDSRILTVKHRLSSDDPSTLSKLGAALLQGTYDARSQYNLRRSTDNDSPSSEEDTKETLKRRLSYQEEEPNSDLHYVKK